MTFFQYHYLEIRNNDGFSLLKDEPSKIFYINKTVRYSALLKQCGRIFSLIKTFKTTNEWKITKEIDLNYLIPILRTGVFINNEQLNSTQKKLSRFRRISPYIKYNNQNIIINDFKKVKNSFSLFNNINNKLIKPIMFEGSIQNNIFPKIDNVHITINNNIVINHQNNAYSQKSEYITEKKRNFNSNLKFPKFYDEFQNNISAFDELNSKKSPIFPSVNSFQEMLMNTQCKDNYKPKMSFITGNQSNSYEEKLVNSNTNDSSVIKKEDNFKSVKNTINKGRKSKNSIITESKHTKYSKDNMMRKIKNKVLESSRLLINKVLRDEFEKETSSKFYIKEFKKIQGSFGQELNIKFNIWFYQINIKEIFCLEISNKYSASQKSSNRQLIEFLYSDKNKDKFIKSKKLLETPFHQYYHEIFLGESSDWKKYYNISESENIYEIGYLLKNLEEEKNTDIKEQKKYVHDLYSLAKNYENFFFEKKPRNLEHRNKKNEFIKSFIVSFLNKKYVKLTEDAKNLKKFYESKKIDENVEKNEKNDKKYKKIFNIESKIENEPSFVEEIKNYEIKNQTEEIQEKQFCNHKRKIVL